MEKKKFSDNISAGEVLLLVVLFLGYVGTIAFFLLNLRTYFFLFFLFYSCISVVFLLVSHAKMTGASLRQESRMSPVLRRKSK